MNYYELFSIILCICYVSAGSIVAIAYQLEVRLKYFDEAPTENEDCSNSLQPLLAQAPYCLVYLELANFCGDGDDCVICSLLISNSLLSFILKLYE